MVTDSTGLFSNLALSPSLLQVVQELGYEKMTPVQAKAIPILLDGKDLIGQSKTGSGKTAAFALPILECMEPEANLQALVLCPTRELSDQVAREIRKLGRKRSGLQVLVVCGGQPMSDQRRALEKGTHVVVGTPGRVLDHITRKTLDLSSIKTLVLDEADRMLEMGFQADMEKILAETPEERQTVFFSATFPSSILSMSRMYQRKPERVTIDEEDNTPPIRQIVYEANQETKLNALIWILQQNQPESAIIFCNQKATVDDVSQALQRAGVSAGCIHGDLEQNDRDRVMAKFRNQSTKILVATDVAARGIDVANLDLVLNYDLPQKVEIYVHRIGRTGRAGKRGLAISLATTREKSRIQAIETSTGAKLEQKTVASSQQLDAEVQKTVLQQDAKMDTLYISGGRKEKMRPGDILGALTGEAGGLNAAHIGKIEIHDHFSYVAVAKHISQTAILRLNTGKIKGRRFRVERVK